MLTASYILGFRAWALRLRVLVGLLLGGWAAGAWAEPVQALSRPTRNTWVVDMTGALADATLVELDRIGSEVERSGRGQLVVAVVLTTDGRPARTFATELFNRWGIGHARRDDGALLFIALRDRKAEIILGDGVDTPEDVARSRELMRGSIVPAFQRGDPNAAVLAGARGLKTLLESAPINRGLGQGVGLPLALPQRPAVPQPSKKPAPKKETQKESQPVRERKEFLDDEGMYVELSTSGSSEDEGAASSTSATQEQLPSSGAATRRESGTGAAQQSSVSPWAWAVVGGFFLLLIVGNWLRRRSVACERCGSTNVKVSTSTLLDAGDHNDGLVEVTVRCRRCGHIGTSTRMTSSRHHSHSDSHGGSLGGGRSSGGGASGSW